VALPPPWAVCAFMLLNRVTSECVCRLSPLVLSDLVDEDVFLNRRPQQLSASIVGTAAFASKFSQSLAPMLGYFALSMARAPGPGNSEGVRVDMEVEGEGVTLGMGVEAPGPGQYDDLNARSPSSQQDLTPSDHTHHSMAFTNPATGHADAGAALHAHAAHSFQGEGASAGEGLFGSGAGGEAKALVRATIWALLVLVPVACVAIQTVVWEGYTLRGRYLKLIKGGEDEDCDDDDARHVDGHIGKG